jgi:hypothetical protein
VNVRVDHSRHDPLAGCVDRVLSLRWIDIRLDPFDHAFGNSHVGSFIEAGFGIEYPSVSN